ncbi:MAG: dephospho-CoA kinase [Actinobacteria bacterium]|nr:MAG: dephospho-CoA kinase [Actinomycetota bacterium]TMK65932.1 MAG: dephospho-CoA kinase [Actinomycetota bacterium]
MLLVGLTGGIGSGKSTVARMLEKRGAVVFDADVLARQAVAPGTPGFEKVVERFGPNVLAPGGGLDREALASIVFSDPAARRDLEGIVHPEVRRMFAEGCEEYRDSDRVVVFSAPLLVETGMHTAFDLLIVVSAPVATQIERLMRDRGMAERDVQARIDAQLPLEAKAEAADVLVDNEGTLEDLEAQVERVWRNLVTRAGSGAS